ncbi:hypothetical protein JCM10296v2_001962 [Rhodotorula toruloides]
MAEAEAAEKKRRDDEAERVRAEAAEKERARLDAEAKERARLEAEEKERVRREAEAKERVRLQEEERTKREAEETARKEREAKAEAERAEKQRIASERKEKERQAREESKRREEAEKKARLDAELEAQEKERQEATRKEDERKKKERLGEERMAKEAEAKAKLDAELEAQEKEHQEEMRKEEERKAELRKEEERKAKIAELAARQAERDRRALAAREEEAKKAERERQELARLAALARKKKEEEERRRQAADDEARKNAEEEAKQKAENEEKEKKRAAKEEEEREAEETMWRKEIPRLWAATTYAWTVRPGCPATLSIVKDRNQVFAKQRKVGTRPAGVQRTSRKIIAEHMATYTHGTGGRAAYALRVRDYESFCRSVDVPPWPLSTVMIALFCIATSPNGFALSTASNVVTALRNSTRDCADDWQALPGFSELATWPKADQALTEWKNLLSLIPDEEDSPVETPQGTSPAASEAAYKAEEDDEEEEEEDAADEDGEDGADLDEDEVSDSEAKCKFGKPGKRAAEMKKFVVECTKKYPLPDMPEMPRPGKSFANHQALLKAVAVALVPALGVTPTLTSQIVSCRRRTDGCPFRISTVKRADGKLVVKANSVYAHNHGIDQRLIADPNWRPAMRNDAVAAAVAKHDKLSASKKGKKRVSTSSELPVAKHPRRESGTVKSDAARRKTATNATAVERDEPADPDSVTAAKDASPLPASTDPPRSEDKPTQAEVGDLDLDFGRSLARGETNTSAVKPASPPAQTDASLVEADSSTPAPQLPTRPSLPLANSPAAVSSYRPFLEAFLVALHPSLAPLTDPLLTAGINSDRSLALFAGMERASRHALYEDLRIEGDMPMLDVAAVEALDEVCSRAQATQWAIKDPL